MKPYLNLGCGRRYHPDWINIDIAAHGVGVMAYDLRRGIPLPDKNCELVYHSHVLEHFRREDALPFMNECGRVLKPGGILRVATPNLERICELYLEKLRAAPLADRALEADYDWVLLEMYDQTVREKPGGAMLDFLRQSPLPNEEFVFARIGEEGREIVEALRREPPHTTPARYSLKGLLRRPRTLFECFGDQACRWIFGAAGAQAMRIGRFRLRGEVHQWMYDRHSLARLMLAAGLCEPTLCSPAESRIPHWNEFCLDALPDGRVIKPDSLFMEGVKSR